MNTFLLVEHVKFDEHRPRAEPVFVGKDSRALLFCLRAGQSVKEHNAPHSPVNIVVLKGHGMFAGGDKKESLLGSNALVVIGPGEDHTIRAVDEDLVFLVILHGAPDYT
jgi:quercetin dioxygenase-like cupin family protein